MRTTTALTLGEAAKATGEAKPTILRAIQKGRISAVKDDAGIWMIEPAELFRVYDRVVEQPEDNSLQATHDVTADNPPVTPQTTGDNGALVALLREQIADLKQDRERERAIADALRQEIEQGREERLSLVKTITEQAEHVRLLTHERQSVEAQPPAPSRRGFLGIFRR